MADRIETRGDLAREQLRRRGVPYFGDVVDDVEGRLSRRSREERAALAAACAERLQRWHSALPPLAQRPFTAKWVEPLDELWAALHGDAEAAVRVARALEEFRGSPYDHSEGQEGPDDADDDPAAASIQAIAAFVDGDPEAAFESVERAVEHAFTLAEAELQLDPNLFDWDPNADPPSPLARESMHPAVQTELARLRADLELIERGGITDATLERLRHPSEPPPSGATIG